MIKYLPNDRVAIHSYSSQVVKLSFHAWLNITDRALATFEASLSKPVTDTAYSVIRWLRACNITLCEQSAPF